MIDNRLVGTTAENIFLRLLNQAGVFSTAFNTENLDGICFDNGHQFFKVGEAPFYVQIKGRGSATNQFNPQGRSVETIQKIRIVAQRLEICFLAISDYY